MTTAYIGIGSNVGDRQSFCRRAVDALGKSEGVTIDAASSLYETAPIGPPQRSYVNMVVRIVTELDPRRLMHLCKRIEERLGREPSEMKWGPRVIDLDLLLYGGEKISEPDLEVPHPHMTERNFVLVPLLEIDPDAADPWETPLKVYAEDAAGEVVLLEPFDRGSGSGLD
jgi:2-amino-4-hydroxy-6-hydroxymethyldihydropteridine diphosphokinase